MDKVVITGGAGFIGSHLADALIDAGFEVHIIDTLVSGKKEHVHPQAILHIEDIRNVQALTSLIKGAKYVFHMAALPSVQYSIEQPYETHDVNILGVLNVLEAARNAKVQKVIYSGSSAVYGDCEILPLREDLRADPKSPYALHKYVGEVHCRTWSQVYGLPTVVLRYFNVYGPRLNAEGAYASAVGIFLKQKKQGKPLTITGDGMQTRDMVHVRDVVRANLLAAYSSAASKGEVFNIGSGRRSAIKEIADLIGGAIEYLPARLEPRHSLADITKAASILKWKPEVTLEDGLSELQ